MGVTNELIEGFLYSKCSFNDDDLKSCVIEDAYVVNYDEKYVYCVCDDDDNIELSMINRLHLDDMSHSEEKEHNIIDLTRFSHLDKDFFVGEIVQIEINTYKFFKDIVSSVDVSNSELLTIQNDKVMVVKEESVVASAILLDIVAQIKCLYKKDNISSLYDKLVKDRSDYEDKEDFVLKDYYFQRYYDKKCIISFRSFNGCPGRCYIVNEDDKNIYYVKNNKGNVKKGMVAKNSIDSIHLYSKKDKDEIDLERYRHLSKEDFIGKTVDFSLKYKGFLSEIFGKKTWYHKVKIHMWDTKSVIIKTNKKDRHMEMPIDEFAFIEEV